MKPIWAPWPSRSNLSQARGLLNGIPGGFQKLGARAARVAIFMTDSCELQPSTPPHTLSYLIPTSHITWDMDNFHTSSSPKKHQCRSVPCLTLKWLWDVVSPINHHSTSQLLLQCGDAVLKGLGEEVADSSWFIEIFSGIKRWNDQKWW